MRYSTRIVANRIKSAYASGKIAAAKRLRYSNRAVTSSHACSKAGDTPGKNFHG